MIKFTYITVLSLLVFLLSGCVKSDNNNKLEENDMIIAAKLFKVLSNNALENQIVIMKNLKINQLYVRPEQALKSGSPEILDEANIDLWLIAPIFYNDENQDISPTPRWAVCDNGEIAQEKSENGNWLKMVCPNDTNYLDYRISYLEDVLSMCKFKGISLDFIRYFVFWEEVFEDTPSETLHNSCFCDACINCFKEYLQLPAIQGDNIKDKTDFIIKNYFDEWTDFKCAVISENVEKIISRLRQKNPFLEVNLHAVPWTKSDFNGSIRSIVGQDFSILSNKLTLLTPMVYSKMLRRNGQWINDLVKSLHEECNGKVKVIPAIQCKSVYGESFNDGDFEDILKNAVKSPSSGVSIWPFEDLTDEKIKIIEQALRR
ncbi:MAG: hypothetical protein LBH98_07510 [Chitinispirillales bacterium]|jgi:hypothetical protein|nr:hypothetical protein [Chitinispirillales bacterium]